jgi:hypothetical protein
MTPARIDYLDDPAAPAATSTVPSVNVIVVNDPGQIRMIRRTDNGRSRPPNCENLPYELLRARPLRARQRRLDQARRPSADASERAGEQ